MKLFKQTVTFLSVVLTLTCSAQDPDRKHGIGLYQNFTDYNVRLLDNELFAFDSSLSHSTRIAYQRKLSRTWMLSTGIANGFILNQNIKEEFISKAYALGLDVSVRFKLNNGRILKENPLIAPYFTFGYRTDYIPKMNDFGKSPWVFHNQYGAGFNFRLSNRTHFLIQAAIDQKLLGDFNTQLQYRMGLSQSLGRLDDKGPKIKQMDSDRDGIADALDKCPTQFGTKDMGGCPDTLAQFAHKIVVDSLEYLLNAKSSELELKELELARVRNSIGNDSVSLEEKLQVKQIKEAKDKEIAELKQQLENQKGKTVTTVDTIYITETVYKVQEVDSSSRVEERQRLAAEKKALQEKLDKERKLREQMLAAAKEKERLALEEERRIKEENRRLAMLEQRRKDSIANIKKQEVEFPPIPEDKNYYVITISSPNKYTADKWLQKMLRDFDDARIIPQPNGYYRVGVYVGKDRAVGLEILEKVKQIGYDPAWLSVE
ncbi:MAG: hypothetical protein KJP21_07410 [Bacteroidia bacterium]|nr:hypothetical protein [Bacteroidia bacterium]NNJ55043.1 hypothetical protein [Bacteroidia bacterium]